MAQTAQIESKILRELRLCGPCDIEELVRRLPRYSWNQVFTTVDRLSRQAKLTLRHPTRFEYVVSIASSPSDAECDSARSDQDTLAV